MQPCVLIRAGFPSGMNLGYGPAIVRTREREPSPSHPRRGDSDRIRGVGEGGGQFWRISISYRAETKIDSRDGHETG